MDSSCVCDWSGGRKQGCWHADAETKPYLIPAKSGLRQPLNTRSAPKRLVGLVLLIATTLSQAVAQDSGEKVILDVDVGIDDAMAILFASKSPEIELLGVTTVFGNSSIDDSTRNALFLLERCGLRVPVAQGAACRS